jgi:hypothetical protein
VIFAAVMPCARWGVDVIICPSHACLTSETRFHGFRRDNSRIVAIRSLWWVPTTGLVAAPADVARGPSELIGSRDLVAKLVAPRGSIFSVSSNR